MNEIREGGVPNVSSDNTLQPKEKILHDLPKSNNYPMKIMVGLVVVVAGVVAGWVTSDVHSGQSSTSGTEAPVEQAMIDEGMFSDGSSGVLYEGGINGEGTHHLDTGSGKEKYVYLLSTVIDLQSFVGKKVEVQGQTLAAEHAGWLMDVGRVKIIE